MRTVLYLLLLSVSVCCSVEHGMELPSFSEEVGEQNGLRISDSVFVDFSRHIADMPDVEACIGRLYDMADSLSTEFGDSETLECLSDQFASVFFNADSPYCDDRIYSMVIGQELLRINSFPPYHKKMLEFRSDILSLGLTGTMFPYPCTEGVPTVVVVKAEDCAECDRIIQELSQSRMIQKAKKKGRLSVLVQNVSDGFLMSVTLDPRYVPSLYLVGADGLILIRACRSVKELLKTEVFLDAIS